MKKFSVIVGIFFIFCITVFAASNHQPVSISLWPFPFAAEMPLYLVVLATAVFSFICGGFFVWLSDVGIRLDRYRKNKQIQALEKQLK